MVWGCCKTRDVRNWWAIEDDHQTFFFLSKKLVLENLKNLGTNLNSWRYDYWCCIIEILPVGLLFPRRKKKQTDKMFQTLLTLWQFLMAKFFFFFCKTFLSRKRRKKKQWTKPVNKWRRYIDKRELINFEIIMRRQTKNFQRGPPSLVGICTVCACWLENDRYLFFNVFFFNSSMLDQAEGGGGN